MNTGVLNNWGAVLADAFNEISEKVFDYTDVLIYSAQIVCGIFAFSYVGLRLWKQWSNGEVINIYSYLRPFVICLIISFLSPLSSLFDVIVKPIETVTLNINQEILVDFQEKETQYYEYYDKLRDKVAVNEREEVETGIKDIITDTSNITGDSEESTKINLFRFIAECLENIIQYVQMAVIYFFPLYVSLSKVILLIIGPFMLALSIMPSFSGNISLWITYYIRIIIIPSIFYLVSSFMAIVNIHCYYVPLIEMIQNVINMDDEFFLLEMSKDFLYNKNLIGIVVGLLTICIYVQIPKFANWIIKPDRYKKY